MGSRFQVQRQVSRTPPAAFNHCAQPRSAPIFLLDSPQGRVDVGATAHPGALPALDARYTVTHGCCTMSREQGRNFRGRGRGVAEAGGEKVNTPACPPFPLLRERC